MAAIQQECGICMESCKNPFQISCHHSFCCNCLEDYVQVNLRKGRFDCPICRTNVELPEGGVRCFETKSCTDTNSDEKFECDLCGLKSVACSRCLDCEENLCQSCCYVHEKLKVSRHHKVRDLGTLDSAMKGKLRQRTFCDQHPEEEIKLMCRDCNILVCVLCKAVDHENHATKTVADVAAEMKKTLLTKMTSCSGKLRNISASKEKAEELERSIDGAEREELKSVEDQHSQLNQVLGQEVAKVKATIKNVYLSLRQQNTILKRDIQDELRTCSDVYENAQKLTQQGSDIEIIKKGPDLDQLISKAISKTDQIPNIGLKNKLFSPAEIKQSELIALIGKMQDSTESPSFRPGNRDFAEGSNFVDFTPRYVWSGGPKRIPETESSTPVVEKEENDLSECAKDQETEKTPPPTIVNEEVLDHMDINENMEICDVSIAIENEMTEKMKYKEDQWTEINHEGKKCDGDLQLQPQNAPESALDIADIPDIIIEKPPETEASSPVVEEEEDPTEGIKDQDRVIAAEMTPPPPIVNEEVDNTVDINNANDVSEVFENEKNKKLKLKYKYKEDQWSPINHEGKKQYDRDFLLQLQNAPESTLKPLDLPDIPDIIIEKPSFRPGNRDFAEGSNFVDFTPRYVWSGGPNRSGGVPRRSSGQRIRGGPGGSATQAKHINLSIQKDIELHHAKEAWKPGHRAEKIDQGDVDLKSEDLYKKVQSILNKLTPQKFQTLVAKMQALEIDTETRLKNVIDLVFEKAICEPEFSVAYSNMCRCLSVFKVPAESKQGDVNFRALLLTRCQREFEKANSSEKEFDTKRKEIEKATTEEQKLQMKEELEYEETKAKMRSLGNIRFIGELFKLKMLTENIMHDCVFKLLRTKDEENLECLCRLLKSIGKELDTDKVKPRMDQYFQQMLKIVNEKKLSSRVRFTLQDVIELRRGKWVPRRDYNNCKTIDQIHREVAQEAQDRALFVQTLPQAKPQKGNRGRPGQPSGPMGVGADGWNTVSRAPLRTDRTIDPTKLKLSKLGDSENIQLGPGGGAARLGWFKGSTGVGARSQEGERPNAPGNRFSALSKAEKSEDDSSCKGAGRGGFGRPAPPANHPSQESEREKALAAAKTIVAQRPSEERSGGRETERAKTVEKPSTPVQELTDDQMLSKTRAIMDEYLHIQDVKEAVSCVQELSSSGSLHLFVSNALNQVLERSEVARRQTGLLLHDLVKNNVLLVDTYVKGLNEILMFAEDMEIDIPKIWEYLGQLIGPMVQDGSVPLGFLKQVCEPLRANGKSGILVAEILHDASHREGHKKVGKLWAESGLHWSDFVRKNQIDQFLYEKKLEFTRVGNSAPTSPTASMNISKIEERLNDLITNKGCSNEEVIDWIEGEVDELTIKQEYFIRALMTAVCKSAVTVSSNNLMKVDKSQVQRRNNLLQKYLDHQANFELQALFALQALVHKLEHPPGVLRELFDILYDEDIISEDAFIQWEKSEDPQEQEGKGVAMKQVVQFFTWLKEAEDDAES